MQTSLDVVDITPALGDLLDEPKPKGFVSEVGGDIAKSVRAVSFVLGVYKPTSAEEEQELQKRALAEGIFAAVSAITAGLGGAALRLAAPAARPLLGALVSAISGAAGGAAAAPVEGGDPRTAGIVPGVIGGALHLPYALGQRSRMLATRAAATRQRALYPEMETPIPTGQPPVDTQLDLFDLGLPPWTGKPNAAVPPGGQLSLFGEAPTVAGQSSSVPGVREHYRRLAGALTAEEDALLNPPYNPDLSPQGGPLGEQLALPKLPAPTDPLEQLEIWPNRYKPVKLPETPEQVRFAVGEHPEPVPLGTPFTQTPKPVFTQGAVKYVSAQTGGDKAATAAAREAFVEHLREQGLGPPAGEVPKWGPPATGARRGRPSHVRRLGPAARAADSTPLPAETFTVGNELVDRLLRKLPEEGRPLKALMSDVGRIWDRVATSGREALRHMGPIGAQLSEAATAVDRSAKLRAGEFIARYDDIMHPFRHDAKTRILIGEVKRGERTAPTVGIQRVVDQLRELDAMVADEAVAQRIPVFDPASGGVRPFIPRANYFPVEYSPQAIRQYLTPGTPEHEFAARFIISRGMARDVAGAEKVMRRFFRGPSDITYGHLQISRMLALPGFEKDPNLVYPKYYYRALRRIEQAKVFGPTFEPVRQAIRTLGGQGYDAKVAAELMNAWTAWTPYDYGTLVRATRSFNILSMLTFSGIMQFGQLANILAYTGTKNFMRGVVGVFKKEEKAFAARTGAFVREAIQDLVPIGEQSLAGKWVRFIFLEPLDKANRIAAAVAGRYEAEDLAVKYVAKQSARLAKKLEALGLRPEEVLRQGGRLTEAQRRIAGLTLADKTQFGGEVLDLPALKNTTAGQFVYLFKTFALQQVRFTKDLVNSAVHGDWEPLTRYMLGAGLITGSVGQLVRTLKGKPPPSDNPVWNQLAGMLDAGALGVAWDTIRAVDSGKERLASFLAGPAFSELTRTMPELLAAAQGNPEQFMRHALQEIPGIGEYLADYWLPTE